MPQREDLDQQRPVAANQHPQTAEQADHSQVQQPAAYETANRARGRGDGAYPVAPVAHVHIRWSQALADQSGVHHLPQAGPHAHQHLVAAGAVAGHVEATIVECTSP